MPQRQRPTFELSPLSFIPMPEQDGAGSCRDGSEESRAGCGMKGASCGACAVDPGHAWTSASPISEGTASQVVKHKPFPPEPAALMLSSEVTRCYSSCGWPPEGIVVTVCQSQLVWRWAVCAGSAAASLLLLWGESGEPHPWGLHPWGLP